jgi:hypothetical protein
MTAQTFQLPDDCSPLIRAVFDYWVSIRPRDGLPGRRQFDPVEILPLSPNLWLVDVERNPLRFLIRRIGMEIVNFTGHDPTGQYYDEIFPNFDASTAKKHMAHAAEMGMPAYRRGATNSNPKKTFIMSERITLPMASDSVTVDMLLNLTSYSDAIGGEHVELIGASLEDSLMLDAARESACQSNIGNAG